MTTDVHENIHSCGECNKAHEAHAELAKVVTLPISAIEDGWVLHNGDLYLVVNTGTNQTTHITIPRYDTHKNRRNEAKGARVGKEIL